MTGKMGEDRDGERQSYQGQRQTGRMLTHIQSKSANECKPGGAGATVPPHSADDKVCVFISV